MSVTLFLFVPRFVLDTWRWRRLWLLARMSSPRRAATRLRFPGPILAAAWTSTGRFPLPEPREPTAYRSSATIIRLVFFGRSANVTAFLPHGVGTFQGNVLGTQRQVYRSGLLDLTLRFSVNLKGGPAMAMPQFVKWKQKTLLGASLTVVPPTGQYDPAHLINWSINRWAFKPELGYSRRWGNWILDGYGGVWFYTTNNAFYSVPTPQPQTQSPIGSFEGHLSYDFNKLHAWASLDGNFWFGGTTSLGGVANTVTRQTSSRIGGTFSVPLKKHQSLKVSYNDGDYVRFGGNYQSVSVAWQYSWVGWPKFHEQ